MGQDAGVFTVTRLLPPLGVELQYRIKREIEAHERVAVEQELRVVEVAKSIVVAASRLSSVDVNTGYGFAGLSYTTISTVCVISSGRHRRMRSQTRPRT